MFIHRATILLFIRVMILLVVLGVERVSGLPVWFVFGALSLAQPYDWQTQTALLFVFGVALAIGYVMPFALGFALLWVGLWAMDRVEGSLQSQTLRLAFTTIAVCFGISVLKHMNWTPFIIGLHVLSLAVVVGVYRAYLSYQMWAPQRLQLSKRLQKRM